jgi:hypothetical protein
MNETSFHAPSIGLFLAFVIGACIGLSILIWYYVIRWVFSINRQLKKQDVIIKLLFVIAQKNGATDEELQHLYDEHAKSYKGEVA